MRTTLIEKMPIDWEQPLPNEAHERFCQEYVRLDLDGEVKQAKARKVEAYKFAFPDSKDEVFHKLSSRATNLLRNENVIERLRYLYEQMGTGIENEVKWTRSKAEDALLEIILGQEKTENKMKAIDMLNKLRGIGAPVVEEDEEKNIDSVQIFFNKLKGVKLA